MLEFDDMAEKKIHSKTDLTREVIKVLLSLAAIAGALGALMAVSPL